MNMYRRCVLCFFLFSLLVSSVNMACMTTPCGNVPIAIIKSVCLTLQDKDGKDITPDKLTIIAADGTKTEHQSTWDSEGTGCIGITDPKVDVEVEWKGETLKKTAEIENVNVCSASRVDVTFTSWSVKPLLESTAR